MTSPNKSNVVASVIAASLAAAPISTSAKTVEKFSTQSGEIILQPTNAIQTGVSHTKGSKTVAHTGMTLGNNQTQVKVDGHKNDTYSTVSAFVNANSENGYGILGGSAARNSQNSTTAQGFYAEAGYVARNNGPIHHVSADITHGRASGKTLSQTSAPVSSSQIVGQNTWTETVENDNEIINRTHTDTTWKTTSGTIDTTQRFTGGRTTRTGAEIGFNTVNNGVTTIRADHYDHSHKKDKTVGSIQHTQYGSHGNVRIGADTQKNISLGVSQMIPNTRIEIGAGAKRNLDTGKTSIMGNITMYLGKKPSADTGDYDFVPRTGYEYGNDRFKLANSSNDHYTVQDPMNYGRIVTNIIDKTSTETHTHRDTIEERIAKIKQAAKEKPVEEKPVEKPVEEKPVEKPVEEKPVEEKPVEVIKQPVNLTQITENLQNVEVTLSESWESITIDLSDKIPEGFEIINISAEESERLRWYGAAEGAHIITAIWNNKYELIAPGPDNEYASMGSYVYLTATVKDPNGDIHDIAINKGKAHYVAITRIK